MGGKIRQRSRQRPGFPGRPPVHPQPSRSEDPVFAVQKNVGQHRAHGDSRHFYRTGHSPQAGTATFDRLPDGLGIKLGAAGNARRHPDPVQGGHRNALAQNPVRAHQRGPAA